MTINGGSVTELTLGNNSLSGSIPRELAQLTNLQTLDLSGNSLTGSIPRELAQLTNLEVLRLGFNNFTSSSIPPELAQLANLQVLSLEVMNLTGSIPPELAQLANLRILILENNSLTGIIPPELGQLANLTHLDLASNSLTGIISPEVGELVNLTFINFRVNPELTGPIPNSFTNLTALNSFIFDTTGLCEPQDEAFQTWLSNVNQVASTGAACASNNSPVVTNPIADQTLQLGGSDFFVDLPAVFSDPEGGALSFDDDASDESVVDLNTNGTVLSVTPLAVGTATVTITASDPDGASISDEFVVTVLAAMDPPIVANPISNQTIELGDAPQFILATVFSDPNGDALTFTATPRPGAVVDAQISGGTLTLKTLGLGTETVTVTANDGNGGQVQTSFNVTVIFTPPATVAVNITRPFGNAEQQNNYRLVAVPGAVDRGIASTLSGSSGEDWRVFWDNGNASNFLVEHNGSGTFNLQPGRGFWLSSRQPWTYSETRASVAVTPEASSLVFSAPLHNGWNIISNPFGEDVQWSEVQAFNGFNQPLWRYSGSFNQTSTFTSATSGEAFYYLNQSGASQLKIPYPVPSVTQPAAKAPPTLTLTAAQDNEVFSSITVGRMDDATPGHDVHDQFAPDAPFSGRALRLVNPNIVAERGRLAVEYRPASTPGETFDLVLETEPGEPVTLRAEGLDGFEAEAIVLIDPRTGQPHDLRARAEITLVPEQPQTHLRLLVGSRAYTSEVQAATLPERTVLFANYPNPFSGSTRISYSVPSDAAGEAVRLEVFDVLGRRVQSLVDTQQDAGFYEVAWDACGEAGALLAPGVYVYRLRVGDFTETRRMMLVR